MSEYSKIISVLPPSSSQIREEFKISGFKCNTCYGTKGWYIDSHSVDYDPKRGEYFKECGVCKGTGRLEAEIIIQWKPESNINNNRL